MSITHLNFRANLETWILFFCFTDVKTEGWEVRKDRWEEIKRKQGKSV